MNQKKKYSKGQKITKYSKLNLNIEYTLKLTQLQVN